MIEHHVLHAPLIIFKQKSRAVYIEFLHETREYSVDKRLSPSINS
jgi:hypothetical protein